MIRAFIWGGEIVSYILAIKLIMSNKALCSDWNIKGQYAYNFKHKVIRLLIRRQSDL